MMQLTPEHLEAVQKRIDALPTAAARAQATTVHRLGARYLSVLQAETPVRSGKLRAAYQVAERSTNLEAEYRITNETEYLKWVVKGRGPVVAKRAKALRFVIGGKVLFRRRVGPAKANPFPTRAATAMRAIITQAVADLPTVIIRNYGL